MTTAAGRTTDVPGRRRIDLAKEFGRVKGYGARRPLLAPTFLTLNARRRMHAQSISRGRERERERERGRKKNTRGNSGVIFCSRKTRATALLLRGAMHTNSVIYGHYRIYILSVTEAIIS